MSLILFKLTTLTTIITGLRGIDLGNMLIKRVIAEISNTNPHIRVFATLSPMPYFRSWLLRSLKCAAPSGKTFDYCDCEVGNLLT